MLGIELNPHLQMILYSWDIWQFLETVLVVTAWGGVGNMTGLWEVETTDAAKLPTEDKIALSKKDLLG